MIRELEDGFKDHPASKWLEVGKLETKYDKKEKMHKCVFGLNCKACGEEVLCGEVWFPQGYMKSFSSAKRAKVILKRMFEDLEPWGDRFCFDLFTKHCVDKGENPWEVSKAEDFFGFFNTLKVVGDEGL